MKNSRKLYIDPSSPPKVLLLGNGILQLNNGICWSDLIRSLSRSGSEEKNIDGIPFAMQPEAVCGTNVEEVQRKTAETIKNGEPHELLKQLVSLDFDAILTTNYTYEIEQTISEKDWTERSRRNSHTTLYGSPHVRYNTFKCNLVRGKNGREVPIFHIHGEKDRKHSLVLSYYSYANAVHHLIEMNKRRQNIYEEKQEVGNSLECHGWLDYFLLGDVYAVGFGFDFSEFDIWWAIERKSREHALHGQVHAYTIGDQPDHAKSTMFTSMNIEERFIKLLDDNYSEAYENILKDLKKTFR